MVKLKPQKDILKPKDIVLDIKDSPYYFISLTYQVSPYIQLYFLVNFKYGICNQEEEEVEEKKTLIEDWHYRDRATDVTIAASTVVVPSNTTVLI